MAHHTPASEQRRLVAQWRRSGEPRTKFARSIGVHPSTFANWTRRYPSHVPAVESEPAAFIEVPIEPEPAPVVAPLGMRLSLQGHAPVELAFTTLPPATWFATLLREVSAC